MAIRKVNWQDEELDIYYRKNGYQKSIWKDNEGKPFGIYGYDSQEDADNGYDVVDVQWFTTEQERDDAIFDQGYRDCNSCGITFNLYQDEGLLNLEEILECSEQQQKQWQQINPKIDLTGYFCGCCADLTIEQIEE
jgi:hypothetical protein